VSDVVVALLALVALLLLLTFVAAAMRLHAQRVEPGKGVERIPGPIGRCGPLPVVLVHGLFGFDRIGVPGVKLHYFRGIARHLEGMGCHAHAVRLPWAASVPERARILVDKINALPHDRVDIIAHSLGGLDARYALAHLGLDKKVRALVTIGTPHRGTPIADMATSGPLGLARKAIATLGVPLHAVDWLTPRALERFNAEVCDVPGVRYACVVAGIRDPSTPISLALAPSHAYLKRVVGPNDGLVAMSSQHWGETLAEIEADHWEQIGWRMGIRSTFDAMAMYAWVVERLGDAPGEAIKKAS
jgi:triacylglycerol lipase